MPELLVLLGKQIQERRVAKGWSQEEFASVSGFHRTYVGQIERGEKNLSFENLIKVASALDVTASELLSVLDSRDIYLPPTKPRTEEGTAADVHRAHETQKLMLRLRHQRSALNRTLERLEELITSPTPRDERPRPRPTNRRRSS